ncbi:non-ribosomal peptide synthetase [Albimonas pacifica]|uniref:Non-ribosomal peptide synthase domain TIGR01720/amino acid adenylation domain-containing protein n=1 Tax=Albimonas pacifica TaxID=1114924 RepID=A0A1I3DAW2_9RHOB|nr:non-ribosomal peptide synthetase [Albimonas pacifica]SFH83729.1 non-ribosomal peptide synthase domain TIGR01720/amino acid adenylation domain-containing protein [Albimonas pacifica]
MPEDHAIPAPETSDRRALLAARLRRAAEGGGELRRAPLSLAQQRLWFVEQMAPGGSAYTISSALRLEGALDVPRLSAALSRIRARHASLRTRFEDEGGAPLQAIDPPQPLELARADLAADPQALEAALAAFAAQPFDLAAGPLVRCLLVRLAPETHVLALAAHHIIADHRSLEVMIADLVALYRDPAAAPPVPAMSYAAHALAQRGRAGEFEAQAEAWRQELDGLAPLLDLPTDLPRPARRDPAGARLRFEAPDALLPRIEALARAHATTPYVVLLAGFHALHARYSGAQDICIGTTVSNRDRAEVADTVGYFANTLALRARIDPAESFAATVARLKTVVLSALSRQEVPFERVVELAAPQRNLAHAPLFQSMFNLHRRQPARIELPGLTLSPEPTPGRGARFDLSLDLFLGERLSGVLEYATDLFLPQTAQRLADDYLRLLDQATAEPDRPLAEIDLLDAHDRATLAALNDTARPLPEAELSDLLATAMRARGDAPALEAGETRLTHAELDAAAERLADALAPRLPEGARVAVCLPRDADLPVALLAALKLGAPYVPLDPTHPPRRLAGILEAAAPALILTKGPPPEGTACPVFDLAAPPPPAPARAPRRAPRGEDLAYVIFTSGTTGRPKGVPIRRESLANLLTSMAERPGMGASDTLVSVTTPAFDIAGLELFLPLMTGGRLVLADAWDVIDGAALRDLLARSAATMMQATPATWRLLAEEGWRAPEGFAMLCGGEALDLALAARLLEGEGRLWNLYGPTETTIWSACAEVTPADLARRLIPLGRPIANTTLHVLDASGRDCPPGAAGELHIGGLGLSPGYLDRPDLTAERFVERQGARLYRTGDRARRLADGTLVYLGRLDFQVKLRGFRIELGEIEGALAEDPAVLEAVAALHGAGEDAALVAWCRAEGDLSTHEPRLRARLAERLPAYMVPSLFVQIEAFPLNANGKVDRLRLPPPAPRAEPDGPPRSGVEAMLSRLWAELLETDAPGPAADFFALGGHSLLAMRMIARIPHRGPRATPLRLLFEHPRLGDFAAALEAAEILDETPPPPIPPLPETAEPPLSPAQARQWTLESLDPGNTAYTLAAALRLRGPLDPARLARAWTLLQARHETLRSAYPAPDGAPRIAIRPPEATYLTPAAATPESLEDAMRAEAARPFDLSAGPLARLRLYALGEDDHALLLTLHHIVGDAISLQIALRDLTEIYAALARDPEHRPAALPLRYADFAAWQRGRDLSASVAHWVERLRGAPPLLEIPTDFPRPARQSFAGGSVDVELSGETAQALRTLAAQQGATPYMAMLAAWAVLLGRYARTDEAVIGTPVTSRPHPDLSEMVGLFVDTVVHRLPAESPAGFRAILDACRRQVIEGIEHQDAPFEQVIEALDPERSWSHNPVFQTLFSWKTREATPAETAGIAWESLPLPGAGARLDLALGVLDLGEALRIRLEYRSDLFRPETAADMLRAYETLLASAVAEPDRPTAELPLLHPDQARRLAAWNDTGTIPLDGPQTLHGLVSARAAQAGGRIAIRDAGHAITYAALEARSGALAAHLQALGVGRADRVGIALPRRIDMVAAMLAVLKAGAAYVPLDPAYPADRIAYVARDAELALVLSLGDGGDGGEGRLDLSDFWQGPPGLGDGPRGPAARPVEAEVAGEDLAYLIYTSGSTGAPKGVALEHRNAVALIRWAEEQFAPGELSGVLGSTSICFDLSVFEIFATLALGGTLLLVDDLFALPEAAFRDQVTLVNTVPTPMTELLRLAPLPPSVRTVCLAGEPLPPALAERLHAIPSVAQVWNLYGPSEDTTYSTACRLPREGAFNIGRPIRGTQAHVLDERLAPVPPGMAGELFLSGAGVARGYWNRPELTAERFLANPFDAGGAPVMYRTGDRVRHAVDGTLDYLGRGDRQVKVRGFRVEPGEVEDALARLPGVAAAAVDVWRDAQGHRRLVAWVETAAPDAADLGEALSRFLPAHLVPSIFVPLGALPRLPNGKVDRNALPPPQPEDPARAALADLPRPGLEERLAQTWRRVLGRERVGRSEGFFALGGDSILAIQAVAQARAQGLDLSPRDIFQFPTLAALAEAVRGREAIATEAPQGPPPLTPAQRRFLARDLPQAHHWNRAVMLAPSRPLDPDLLARALTLLAERHDALRLRFRRGPQGREPSLAPAPGAAPLTLAEGDVTEAAARMQAGFDLAEGPLWGAVLGTGADGGQRLAVAAHRLLADAASWRILLDDLEAIHAALEAGETPPPRLRAPLPPETPDAAPGDPAAFPLDDPDGSNLERDARTHLLVPGPETAARLLHEAPAAFPVAPREALAAALALALAEHTGEPGVDLELESHGRDALPGAPDPGGAGGWLSACRSVRLDLPPGAGPAEALRSAKDALRGPPRPGGPAPAVRFAFLGEAPALPAAGALLRPAPESPGPLRGPDNPRDAALEIDARVVEGAMRLGLTHSAAQLRPETVARIAGRIASQLDAILAHCLAGEDAGFTPADFPDMAFGQDELDDLLQSL